MQTRSGLRVILVALGLGSALTACGSNPVGIYIKVWGNPPAIITVGVSTSVTLTLSEAVKNKTFVDINNPYPELVTVDPSDFLTFKADEWQKSFTLKGVKESNGNIALTFTIRDTNPPEKRDLNFRVAGPTIPDSGKPLDYGAPPPDQAVVVDQAIKLEAAQSH
jgi:hypothetical protein